MKCHLSRLHQHFELVAKLKKLGKRIHWGFFVVSSVPPPMQCCLPFSVNNFVQSSMFHSGLGCVLNFPPHPPPPRNKILQNLHFKYTCLERLFLFETTLFKLLSRRIESIHWLSGGNSEKASPGLGRALSDGTAPGYWLNISSSTSR